MQFSWTSTTPITTYSIAVTGTIKNNAATTGTFNVLIFDACASSTLSASTMVN